MAGSSWAMGHGGPWDGRQSEAREVRRSQAKSGPDEWSGLWRGSNQGEALERLLFPPLSDLLATGVFYCILHYTTKLPNRIDD